MESKFKSEKIENLKFESVTFSHENHDATLFQADFDFPMNEVVWVKSYEGEGKSTVLQMLAGLITPQNGKYLINDVNVTEMSFEEFLPYRLSIGFSFDYGGLINNRSVFENIILPLEYHKVLPYKEAKLRVESIIQRFEIEKFKNERPAHVPGRVRKLTCLIRALIMYPQVLLLDDASVGVGQDNSQKLAELITELRKEGHLRHVFLTSYDEKFVNLFDHKIIQIDQTQLFHQNANLEKKVINL
ncbi:MAG: ATP-binding cassette domain-containing protein [Bdellovibrionota bacterium]